MSYKPAWLPLLLERVGMRRIKSTAYIFLIPTFSLKEGGACTCVDTYGPRVSYKKNVTRVCCGKLMGVISLCLLEVPLRLAIRDYTTGSTRLSCDSTQQGNHTMLPLSVAACCRYRSLAIALLRCRRILRWPIPLRRIKFNVILRMSARFSGEWLVRVRFLSSSKWISNTQCCWW